MKFKLSNGYNLHVCKPSPVYFGGHLISPSRVAYHHMLYRYCHSVKLISFKCTYIYIVYKPTFNDVQSLLKCSATLIICFNHGFNFSI